MQAPSLKSQSPRAKAHKLKVKKLKKQKKSHKFASLSGSVDNDSQTYDFSSVGSLSSELKNDSLYKVVFCFYSVEMFATVIYLQRHHYPPLRT